MLFEAGAGLEGIKRIAKGVLTGFIGSGFYRRGCGRFRLAHRLFFNNLEK
jgi:hypothetical protein